MILTRQLKWLLATAFLLISNTAFSGDFLNSKPLLKNATTANAGKELLVPRIREIDENADGFPDRIGLLFRIFNPATRTRLFSSTERRVTVPSIPCNNPVNANLDVSLDFLGEDNTRTGMLLVMVTECNEQGSGEFKEQIRTALYMADTTRDSGNTWIRSWNQDGISAHITNWDDDPAQEVMVILVTENQDGEDVTVKMLNKANGAQESSESYPLLLF